MCLKKLVLALLTVFTVAISYPPSGHASEAALSASDTAKVVQITFIDDEQDPEFMAVLDNKLRLICKWHDGLLFAGQTVGLDYGHDEFELHVTTFGKDGEPKGNIVLYRLGDDPRFYQSR